MPENALDKMKEYGDDPTFSTNEYVQYSPTLIVATVTTKIAKKTNMPTHYLIGSNPAFSEPSVVMLEQIRTIDKQRIASYLGKATKNEMQGIDQALLTSLALGYVTHALSNKCDALSTNP